MTKKYDLGAIPKFSSKSKCCRKVLIPENSPQSLVVSAEGWFVPHFVIRHHHKSHLAKTTNKLSFDELKEIVTDCNEILKNSFMPRNFLVIFIIVLAGLAGILFKYYLAGGIILGVLATVGVIYIFQANRAMPQENQRALAVLVYKQNKRLFWCRKSRMRPGYHALWLEFQFDYNPITDVLSESDSEVFDRYIAAGNSFANDSSMSDTVVSPKRNRRSVMPLPLTKPKRRPHTIVMVGHEDRNWNFRDVKRRSQTDVPRHARGFDSRACPNSLRELSPGKDVGLEKGLGSPWSGALSVLDTDLTDGSASPMMLGHNFPSFSTLPRSSDYLIEDEIPVGKFQLDAAQYLFADENSGGSSSSDLSEGDLEEHPSSDRPKCLTKTLKSFSSVKCDESWMEEKASAFALARRQGQSLNYDEEEVKSESLEFERPSSPGSDEELHPGGNLDEKFREYDVQDQMKIDELVTLEDNTETSEDLSDFHSLPRERFDTEQVDLEAQIVSDVDVDDLKGCKLEGNPSA
mmetsp:Transcript_15988/g.17871  ORF Transcript_15988/g.17871 Transcript_15988/m.17871 type:complete len:518 (+) Transcript_15988:191-1744(+)